VLLIFGHSSVIVSTDYTCRILFVRCSVTRKAYIGPGNNALHSAVNQMGREGKKRGLVSKFCVCVFVCIATELTSFEAV
jgi:hypothetical protein